MKEQLKILEFSDVMSLQSAMNDPGKRKGITFQMACLSIFQFARFLIVSKYNSNFRCFGIEFVEIRPVEIHTCRNKQE